MDILAPGVMIFKSDFLIRHHLWIRYSSADYPYFATSGPLNDIIMYCGSDVCGLLNENEPNG